MDKALETAVIMMSVPIGGYLGIEGEQVGKAKRAELKEALAAGELESITFDALVYKDGPNKNHYRFRVEDLPVFCESFGGQPFLRNHDTWDIGSRDGTIQASKLQGVDFVQEIELTTEQGMKSFVQGQIDRFSIGWYYSGITCSICNSDWFGRDCNHWPGRTYRDGKGENPQTCELIFEDPRGKETSAVNAPAVDGTKILAQLCEQKERNLAKQEVDMNKQKIKTVAKEAPPAVEPAPAVEPVVAQPVIAAVDTGAADWLAYMKEQATDVALAGSGLPPAMQTAVREEFEGNESVTPTLVQAAIARQTRVWAALQQSNVIRGMGTPLDAGSLTTPMDEIREAWNWIFGVPGAKTPPPSLRKTDELYRIVTGDWDWRGLFNPDQAQLAGADTTTLADIAVDAMNKVMVALYDGLEAYRWWEQLVSVQPHDGSTHDMKWLQFGGIGNLPVVAEKAAFTELDVVDTKESDSFVVRGGYVGISKQMLRKSQIALIQAIPRQMVISAIRTRSSDIAAIFTTASGVGPTMSQDSTVLFHTDHSNLAATAFSFAAWAAARVECYQQTELGSGKAQGLWPKFCIVPAELYDPALDVFNYGAGVGNRPGTTDYHVNPYGESRPGDPRPIVVAVPDWTDNFKWAYLADPVIAPVIQISYAQLPGGGSHPLPSLYSVTSPTSGMMFTNNVLPIKVEDEYAYGVATWRGIGKRNATS